MIKILNSDRYQELLYKENRLESLEDILDIYKVGNEHLRKVNDRLNQELNKYKNFQDENK